jgi:hypothetical protein
MEFLSQVKALLLTNNPIHCILPIHNLTQSIRRHTESWIIDVDGAAGVASGENPVSSVVDVTDDDVAGVEMSLDLAVCELSYV